MDRLEEIKEMLKHCGATCKDHGEYYLHCSWLVEKLEELNRDWQKMHDHLHAVQKEIDNAKTVFISEGKTDSGNAILWCCSIPNMGKDTHKGKLIDIEKLENDFPSSATAASNNIEGKCTHSFMVRGECMNCGSRL